MSAKSGVQHKVFIEPIQQDLTLENLHLFVNFKETVHFLDLYICVATPVFHDTKDGIA